MEPEGLAIVAACAGAACALLLAWLFGQLRARAFARIAERDTGEKRRRLAPPRLDLSMEYLDGDLLHEISLSEDVANQRGFLTLANGENIFYQTWSRQSAAVRAVVIFIHGFGDHCDFLVAHKAKALCNSGPFAAVAFDLPGHGRSDGLYVSIPNWHTFVDAVREVVTEHLKPLIGRQWPQARVFGLGESLGGGVLFSMLVRDRELLHGAIMVCPMLFVCRDLFPPAIVMQFFKRVMVPCVPAWPVSPNKDIKEMLFHDQRVKRYVLEDSKHHKQLAYTSKPRVGTAYELAFPAGEWMQGKIPAFDVPALIIHGGGDTVTDHRVSQELFEKMKHPDKEMLHPDGVWHLDLFHGGPTQREGARERLAAVASWLLKRS
mmetsp:Transcript_111103/g.321110  ORF Transcript_111103/g.321110 Transcript_111103/m.321110 type:complete len:376 (-) Transcript_111103:370-1497(-)